MNKLNLIASKTSLVIVWISILMTVTNLQAQTIKSFESFDYNEGTQIASQNGGWGWMGPWTASDAATAITYTATGINPFTYANPSTSGYYVTPGMMQGNNTSNKIIGRYLNTNSAAGNPYNTWIDASGSIVIPNGGFLCFGFMIRKDVLDDKQIAFGISDGLSTQNINNGLSIGYFGPIKSVSNGVRYWTVKYYNGTEYAYYLTNRPIVAGRNEFFIFGLNSATVNNFSVYNSPIIQNSFVASQFALLTIPVFKFRSVFYFSEGNGAVDEIRIALGNNYNVALMYGPSQGLTGVNDPGTGVPGAPVLTSDNNKWKLDGNSGTDPAYHFIGNTDAQDLKIRTNNVERMTVAKDGNVGIGTGTPMGTFHVSSKDINGSVFPVIIEGNSSSAPDETYGRLIRLTDKRVPALPGRNRGYDVGISLDNSFYISKFNYISTNFEKSFVISGDGNIGIGTTTPSQKLEVAGTAKVNTLMFSDGTFMTTSGASFSSSNLTLSPLSATDNNAYISTNGNGTGLIFETPDAGTSIGVPRMAITNNGSIGIGTTTPDAALHVVGDIFMSKANSPAYSTGYSSKLKFDDGDMQGSDPLWIARYNTAYNQSELRINIGDDPADASIMDKLVIGNTVGSNWTAVLTVNSNGEINTSSHIRIGGKVLSQDVKVVSNPLSADFPDYVFKKGYKLETLSNIEAYIKENGHLKEVPSAKEVQEDGGFELGKMNVLLLKKVEELTLHIIEQEKRISSLEKRK